MPNQAFTQFIEHRETSFGIAMYIKVRREDDQPMSWREVYDAYSAIYPHRWAVQFFPPVDRLMDEANVYHLYVLAEVPWGVDINRNGRKADD